MFQQQQPDILFMDDANTNTKNLEVKYFYYKVVMNTIVVGEFV